jgi:hypothetical protein
MALAARAACLMTVSERRNGHRQSSSGHGRKIDVIYNAYDKRALRPKVEDVVASGRYQLRTSSSSTSAT